MDAIMVFDSTNYLIYVKYNRKFLHELSVLAQKHGLVQCNSLRKINKLLSSNYTELENVIVLVFAPFVASIRVLQTQCPPLDVFLDGSDKIRTVHSQFLDYIFIYISDKDNFCNIKLMKRQLDCFTSMAKMLFGASIGSMKSEPNQTAFLTALYRHWTLNKQTPTFLVEATERLILSVSIQNEFIGLLHNCMQKIRHSISTISEELPSHGLLFVEKKLVSHLSSRNSSKISGGNLVLLSLIADTLEARQDRHDNEEDKIKIILTSDEEYDGDDDQSDEDVESTKSFETTKSRLSSITSRSDSSFLLLPMFHQIESKVIFLSSSVDHRCLVPYYMRWIRIKDGISLMILSQLPTTSVTFHMHKLWHILDSLQYRTIELKNSITLSEFDNSLQKLMKTFAFLKLKSDSVTALYCKMNNLANSEIRKYILSLDNEELPLKLDSLCSSICSLLRTVYCEKIFLHHYRSIRRIDGDLKMHSKLMDIKSICTKVALDYGEFLTVKAQRNTSVDAFTDAIPDLIAFIYVDRNCNEFVSAKLEDYEIDLEEVKLLNLNLAHNLLAQLVEKAYMNLSEGRLSYSYSDLYLTYNYLFWFEKSDGKPMTSVRELLCNMPYPSMISNNFVERISIFCLPNRNGYRFREKCYELFYITKKGKVDQKSSDELMTEAKRETIALEMTTINRPFIQCTHEFDSPSMRWKFKHEANDDGTMSDSLGEVTASIVDDVTQ